VKTLFHDGKKLRPQGKDLEGRQELVR